MLIIIELFKISFFWLKEKVDILSTLVDSLHDIECSFSLILCVTVFGLASPQCNNVLALAPFLSLDMSDINTFF